MGGAGAGDSAGGDAGDACDAVDVVGGAGGGFMWFAVVVLLLVIAFEPTGRQASGGRYQWSAVAISSRGLEHKKVILIQSPTVALVNPN